MSLLLRSPARRHKCCVPISIRALAKGVDDTIADRCFGRPSKGSHSQSASSPGARFRGRPSRQHLQMDSPGVRTRSIPSVAIRFGR